MKLTPKPHNNNEASNGAIHSPMDDDMSADMGKTLCLRSFIGIWLKIGLLSFGGPAAQIALMHRVLVDEKKWLSESQYLNALSFCMLLPGPEAMQLATYSGWRLKGVMGGLIAGLLFVIPGAIMILSLAIFYVHYIDLSWVQGVFLGLKAAIIAVLIQAVIKLAQRALISSMHVVIAMTSFIAIYFFNVSFPLIILIAGLLGYIFHPKTVITGVDSNIQSLPSLCLTTSFNERYQYSLKHIIIWSALWMVPLIIINAQHELLGDIGFFFSKLAVVSFGGAYAVLAYMAQHVVADLQWISAVQMLDALSLAETTPGPLILVTEFVGFLAAYYQEGLTIAIMAALVTLWVTFIPCFLWIFVFAPYIEWISSQAKLSSALSAISAAVVGVILNVSLWFMMAVFFKVIINQQLGAVKLAFPDFSSIDGSVVFIFLISALLLFRFKLNLIGVLAVGGLLGLGLHVA